MIRSIISILASYLFMAISTKTIDIALLDVACQLILEINPYTYLSINILSVIYYLVLATISGYITVRLSHHSELRHDLVLALMLIIQGIIFMGTDEQLPIWWHTVYVLLIMPAVLLGGFIRMRQHQKDKRQKSKKN